jgi:hypothetical protein
MGLPATLGTLVSSIQSTKTRLSVSGDIGADKFFLKVAKQGFWVYGAEETEVEEASKWAINPNAIATGYACWADAELLDEQMALITEEPIVKSSLAVHNHPWNPQIGLQLVCISGEDKGVQVLYQATSLGARKAFAKLLDSLLEKAGSGSTKLVPIVELEVSSYKHKKWGKVFTPLLTVVDWMSVEDSSVTPEAAEEESGADEAQAQAEAEPEPEPEKEVKPRRSRTRG